MKLHLPDIMHTLESKPLVVLSDLGEPAIVSPRDRRRMALVGKMLPLMHRAEKFIFDSGNDSEPRTVSAVRETALNMLDAELFHLPHALIWIEDPYNDDPKSIMRNYYLVEETPDAIAMYFMQRWNPKTIGQRAKDPSFPTLMLHPRRLVIPLDKPTDKFIVENATATTPEYGKMLGEGVYALKKFIVSLNTEQIIINRIRPEGMRTTGDKRARNYPHSIVQVPLDTPVGTGAGQAGEGRSRRRILVRGYTWGRNTRPLHERRWIKPYWRGENEIEIVEHSHYVVR